MNKVKKFLCYTFTTCMFAVVLSQNAFAAGNAGTGGGATGGNCNGASWNTCYGTSWQKYTVTQDLPTSNTAYFFDNNQTNIIRVYIKSCKRGQTLYNHGFETGDGARLGKGYQVGTLPNSYPYTTEAPHHTSALGNYPGNSSTINSYVSAAGYASTSEAQNAYQKMQAWDSSHGTNYTNGTTWSTVGYFCFDPDVEKNATVTSESHAYVKKNGDSSYQSSPANGSATITVNEGDSVAVGFMHKLNRSGNLTSGVTGTYSYSSSDSSNGTFYSAYAASKDTQGGSFSLNGTTSSINLKYHSKGSTGPANTIGAAFKYVTAPEVTRDTNYTICETISFNPSTFNGSNKTGSDSSRACVTITVKNTTVVQPVTATLRGNTGAYVKRRSDTTYTHSNDTARITVNEGEQIGIAFHHSLTKNNAALTSGVTGTRTYASSDTSGVLYNYSGSSNFNLNSDTVTYSKYHGKGNINKDDPDSAFVWVSTPQVSSTQVYTVCESMTFAKKTFSSDGSSSGSGTTSACVEVTVLNVEPSTATVTGSSEAYVKRSSDATSVRGNNNSDATITVNEGEQIGIIFRHTLNKTGGLTSGITGNRTYSSSDNSGQLYAFSGSSTFNLNSSSSSTSQYHGNSNKSADSEAGAYSWVTAPQVDQDTTYTICETMSFSPTNFTQGGSSSGNGSTRACVKVTVRNVTTYTAKTINFDSKSFAKIGSTIQSSNWDSSKTWNYTANSDYVTISFQHTLIRSGGDVSRTGNGAYAAFSISNSNTGIGNLNGQTWSGTNSTGDGAVVGKSYNENKFTKAIAVGGSFTACQTIQHDGSVTISVGSDGSQNESSRSSLSESSSICVNVSRPYNFDTKPEADFSNTDVIYPGTPTRVEHEVEITGGDPSSPASSTPPDTKVSKIHFVLPGDDYVKDNISKLEGTGTGTTPLDPCAYFSSAAKFGSYVQNCVASIDTGSIPASGYSNETTLDVPDDDIGKKFCVATGVTPASMNNNEWRISGAACRTIAKKPLFQTWSAGIYTKGGILTSGSHKQSTGDSERHLYGSWSEYEVVALKNVKGLASAAAIGYTSDNHATSAKRFDTTDYCRVTRLSIANTTSNPNCGGASGSTGNAQISTSNSSMIDNLKSRYTSTKNIYNGDIPLWNNGAYVNGDSFFNTNLRVKSSVNTIYYIKSTGTINLTGLLANATINGDGLTFVLEADTVNITGNICDGYGTCWSGNDNTILKDRNYSTYSRPGGVPQVLIFARNINIADNVSQIDAWLLASGDINTCTTASGGTVSLSANVCNKQLMFNGPVLANKLLLNRTGGATAGPSTITDLYNGNLTYNGSATPAEIFNLRSDAIMWGYGQAKTAHKSTVTYTRELAPRY